MQNLVPDAMRLNKFQHVELPDNSQMFLRVQGKSLPTASPDVQEADFFTRKTEKIIQEEQKFLEDYQTYQNQYEREMEERYSKAPEPEPEPEPEQ